MENGQVGGVVSPSGSVAVIVAVTSPAAVGVPETVIVPSSLSVGAQPGGQAGDRELEVVAVLVGDHDRDVGVQGSPTVPRSRPASPTR